MLFSHSAQNISPLDDLAFDMYQDPEVAQIIRKLETKKQEAALRKCKLSVADLAMSWDIHCMFISLHLLINSMYVPSDSYD